MVVGSFVEEYSSPFPPSKLWKAGIIDANNLHPKIMPEIVASSEVVQGNGEVGTIRKLTFTPAVKEFRFMKERIDVIDHEKHVFKYSVIEGGFIGKKLKSCSFELCFDATADGGCKGKVTAVYDTIDGETLTEADINAIKAGVGGLVKAVNDHLHANPGAYA